MVYGLEMKDSDNQHRIFPTAADDARVAQTTADKARLSSYELAYTDSDFMLRDECRSVRLQLEWLKPEILQEQHGIDSTVVIFGGARFPDKPTAEQRLKEVTSDLTADPENADLVRKKRIAEHILTNSRYYDEARKLAGLITSSPETRGDNRYVVVTGGGPGVMEAANRGAFEAGGKTIGFNIVLPYEQHPNAYITPDLCFQFHYFAIRKMHFLKRARALVACPGGFGTLDELFETLTLIQTHKIKPVPVLLLGKDYWNRLIDFNLLVEEGAIDENDLSLFEFVDSADEAWGKLKQSWNL
jgi:uncharacterized protein (TIGR00730 family)